MYFNNLVKSLIAFYRVLFFALNSIIDFLDRIRQIIQPWYSTKKHYGGRRLKEVTSWIV